MNPVTKTLGTLVPALTGTALALTACGGGGSGGGDAEYTVGVSFADLSNPVWAELVQEAESYGAEQGLDVNYVDAGDDASKQVTQIENFTQQGVDAIVVCAVEANALEAVTASAQEAGIEVIGYTQVLDNYDAQYLVDAYETGYANGEAAAEWINETYPDAETVEWGLMDLPTFPEIIERAEGIQEAVEDNAPQAELVATSPALTAEEGVSNAENFLQAHPEMKMIATIGGGGAVGANEGVKSAGVTDHDSFGVFGIDATEKEIENIIAGDPQKASISLGGGREHGRHLMDMTRGLLDGEDVEADQYMPIEVIDSSNAEEYKQEVFGD